MDLKKLKPRRRALHVAQVNQRAFNGSISFEDFIINNIDKEKGLTDFRLNVDHIEPDGTIVVYIHPLGRDGETYDGYVRLFEILPKKAIDNLVKLLREKPMP